MKFVISIIRPKGYIHSDCFYDTAEPLAHALRALGHTVELGENIFNHNAETIMFGAHLLPHVPPRAIVYNLEQCGSEAFVRMLRTCQGCRIWDYSESNLSKWNDVNVWPVHVPLGYVPEMTCIEPAENQDIDVLFYGSGNARRAKVLTDLSRSGLKTIYAFPIYRTERDKLIARAKVVLNLQFYDAMIFNITRVAPLLANKKCVVSEIEANSPAEFGLAMCQIPYADMVYGCTLMVKDKDQRKDYEQRGFEMFSKISLKQIMEKVIERTFGTAAAN